MPKENTPGTPYTADDPHTYNIASQRQRFPTITLASAEALCVAASLAACASERGWMIPGAAVMSNHVHVLVMECPPDGSTVRRVLKGVTQAALNKVHGAPRRWWTHRGSDRYLRGELSIERAREYVRDQQSILASVVMNQAVMPVRAR